MHKILVVEDEPDILEMVRYNLVQAGFDVAVAEEGEGVQSHVQENRPDLIILDLMLPGIDGLEVCKGLKQNTDTREIPIVMLTARKDEIDRIVGLELGADDYVIKPFSPRELVLRIRAILRRNMGVKKTAADGDSLLTAGPLILNKAAHQVGVDGVPLDLTSTEFKLLITLMERRGRVQSRDDLLETVWGYEYSGYGRTVDTHIRRLREKLGDA
ncbi:MAG: response regulator transcription factor, partial [Candidatus Latescibacteria bacterium]|nr:response regulator transcription factor [Candidatus Latescibacterota bacterium]